MNDAEIMRRPDQDDDSTTLLDLAIVLRQNMRLLVIGPILAGALGLAGSFLITPSFTATAQILTPQQSQGGVAALLGSLGGLAGAAGGLAGVKNPADQWVGLLESRTIADELIDQFKLRERYEVDYLYQARKVLDQNTTITAGKNGLITIEVSDPEPQQAQSMATAYIDQLQRMSDQLAVTEAAQRRLFFEKQLQQTKTNLVKAEIALSESGISTQVLKSSPEAAVSELVQLKARVAAQDIKVTVMRGSMTEASPEMRQAMLELSSLRAQLNKYSLTENDAGTGKGADYIAKYRDFKYQETLFELFSKQYEMAKIDEAKEGAVIQVVDAPNLPEWKSKPKRGLIAVLTGALALVFTLLFSFSRAAIESIAQDPSNAERINRWRALKGRTKSANKS